jgi:short-subunit dehydrogenase
MHMRFTLKPLDEQVMVITGASSGIGLVTAKHAAQRGACVVLAARNEKDLHDATQVIRDSGGRATYAVAATDRRRTDQRGQCLV